MTAPAVFWPTFLGLSILIIGLIIYRPDYLAPTPRGASRLLALGPVFVGASLAAFAGEHFTAAASLALIIPKWLPARLFIAYFVGVAHLAAAVSFVAKRYVRLSSLCLALMFALFVLLMDLPGAITHPSVQLDWVLAARETSFSIGALALFSIATRGESAERSATIARVARFWIAGVLLFFGVAHLMHPAITPGVPSNVHTAAWVPLPLLLAYATGVLLIAFGGATFSAKHARLGAAAAGGLMLVLTIALYVPQFFLANGVAQHVVAINFIFDTLLFSGTVLVIGRAIAGAGSGVAGGSYAPWYQGAPQLEDVSQRS